MDDGESDEAVWRRVVAGEGPAFGLLWDRHRDALLRRLIARGNAHPDAEDLTAVVFLEAWRRRASVRFVDGSLRPWLLVTAHNVDRNAARARRRHRRFLSALPPPVSVPDHAERIAELDDERLRRLRLLVTGLRPADARLLALTALDGLTVREAAAALGLSESAAKMRLSRMRTAMRADLDAIPEGGTP